MRYFRGATNITSAVVAGTYRTPSLAPSETYLIKAKVTIVSYDFAGGPKRLITISSVANSAIKDAVKFIFKLTTCGC